MTRDGAPYKSCRRLIWLNPLLRFEGYAAIATGARTIICHVDDFRPIHDLESLADLTAARSARAAKRGSRAGRARPGE